jgi:WD40 repeat protein
MKVSHLSWHPNVEEIFASVGKDHLMICTFDGKNSVKAVKGKPKDTISYTTAAWLNDVKYKDLILTAGADGNLYVWKGD